MAESLSILLQELKQNVNNLVFQAVGRIVNASQVFEVSGLNVLRLSIDELVSLNIPSKALSILRDADLLKSQRDSIILTQQEYDTFIKAVTDLRNELNNSIAIISHKLPDQHPDSINIKFPQVRDFQEMSSVSADLHKALSQVLLIDGTDNQATIQSVDNGSIWVNVLIGLGAIKIIKEIIQAALALQAQYFKNQRMAVELESLQIEKESLKNVLQAQETLTESITTQRAQEIQANNNPRDAEYTLKAALAIKIFADIIHRGGEIQPSINAPKEVKEDFPSTKDILRLANIEPKLITGDSKTVTNNPKP